MGKYIKWIAVVMIGLGVVALNLTTLFLMKDTRKKLMQNDERMKEYSLHAMRVGAELLEKMNPEITVLKAKVFQLEQESDPQKTSVENLRKAKDTIFSRVSKLEAELTEEKKSIEDIRAFLLTIKVSAKGVVSQKPETK